MSEPIEVASPLSALPGPRYAGTLYVVSTPIGNLGDISLRAVDVLRSVSLVVAEDTRHSRTLLDRYDIGTRVSAYHEHNEARAAPRLVRRMLDGESVALITDAGTPLLSDPGARLVRAAIEADIAVVPIPGASALLAALVASGIESDQFTFLGFLPRKGSARESLLNSMARSPLTTVVYESPQRLADTLDDLITAGCGDRYCVVAREMTKLHEQFLRGLVAQVRARLDTPVRGEVVIVVAGAPEQVASEEDARLLTQRMRGEGAAPRAIQERLRRELGVPRNEAYRLAHERPAQLDTD